MRRDVHDLRAELLRSALYRGTEDRSAPTSARAERVGRLAGVALVDRDVVERHAEELAHELRGRRLEPLPMRSGADVDVDGAVGLDADVRRLGAVRPDHALGLDVEADSYADEPPRIQPLTLPHAKRLVVDDR